MNYNKSGPKFQSGTISIYNTQKCVYSEISSPDDLQLGIPFNLSISSLPPEKEHSFTDYAKQSYGEIVEYKTIKNLSDFYESVTNRNHSGAEMVDGNRTYPKGHAKRGVESPFLKSDVLVFDIDNDESKQKLKPQYQEFWDDFDNHLNIDQFSEMFKDYEFLIVTSRNHMKDKEDKGKNKRTAREKYHIFMPLGATIEERETIIAKIKQISFYISEQREKSDVGWIDNAPIPETGFYASNDSKMPAKNPG